MANLPRLEHTGLAEYDFLDLGSGVGGSLDFGVKRLGGRRGLGIESDVEKVRSAVRLERDVVLGDARSIPTDARVRFVCMMDFLEHLPSLDDVRRVLERALVVSTEFVFIRHPSFEDEAYLAALGLKQYWADWTGHLSHILLSDFALMLKQLGSFQWTVDYCQPIHSSAHPSILPLDAPPDQSQYDETVCGPKPIVTFSRPVWRHLDITIARPRWDFDTTASGIDTAVQDALAAKERDYRLLLDENRRLRAKFG